MRAARCATLPALSAGLLVLLGAGPAPDVQFIDVTQALGIGFQHGNSATPSKHLVETMGGGVAMLDYDNDGRLDVFFVNGARIAEPLRPGDAPDKSDQAFWNRLYRQGADGTFTDATEKAGLTGMPQNRYGMGVAVGDYDNDGFADLYVTNYGGNTLYHALAGPTPRLAPWATPLPKVYLCSSATPPGGGVHGMAGYYAARTVLRKEFGIRQLPKLAP